MRVTSCLAMIGLTLLAGNAAVHGQQPEDVERRAEPLTYYSKAGPIGQLFRTFKDDARLKQVGIVGLGAGSLAAYSEPDQNWTFFETVEGVKTIAEDPKLLAYLRGARGKVSIGLGDARLRLQGSKDMFGLLVIDTYSSEATPVHLLTREAFALYREHLAADGVLVYHISNRHLNLEPVLANFAADANWVAYVRSHVPSEKERKLGITESKWLVMARKKDHLTPLLKAGAWQTARTKTEARIVLVLKSPTGPFFYALDDLVRRLDSEAESRVPRLFYELDDLIRRLGKTAQALEASRSHHYAQEALRQFWKGDYFVIESSGATDAIPLHLVTKEVLLQELASLRSRIEALERRLCELESARKKQ